MIYTSKKMRPYSVDFRQKIIDVREKEKVSIRKLAERFGVAKSFVQKILKQNQETGDLSPKRQGGGPPPLLNAEQVLIIRELLEKHNDLTLKELKEKFSRKTGISVGITTLWKVSKQLNFSFKKKRFLLPKKTMMKSRKKDWLIGI